MATCWCGQPEEVTHAHTSLSGSGPILVRAAREECPYCECGGANMAGDHHGACRSELAAVRAELDRLKKFNEYRAFLGSPAETQVEQIAALTAELEREKAINAEGLVRFCSDSRAKGCNPCGACAWCVKAAEKERDEARAQVAVLVEEWRSFPITRDVHYMREEVLANLPAATQSLLREVEALRKVAKVARWYRSNATFETWAHVYDKKIEPALAALDAVEATRKKPNG